MLHGHDDYNPLNPLEQDPTDASDYDLGQRRDLLRREKKTAQAELSRTPPGPDYDRIAAGIASLEREFGGIDSELERRNRGIVAKARRAILWIFGG
jgi:hypothetical protein